MPGVFKKLDALSGKSWLDIPERMVTQQKFTRSMTLLHPKRSLIFHNNFSKGSVATNSLSSPQHFGGALKAGSLYCPI